MATLATLTSGSLIYIQRFFHGNLKDIRVDVEILNKWLIKVVSSLKI